MSFDWNEKCEESFQELKKRLTITLVLITPVSGEKYTIFCDASRVAWGVYLCKKVEWLPMPLGN